MRRQSGGQSGGPTEPVSKRQCTAGSSSAEQEPPQPPRELAPHNPPGRRSIGGMLQLPSAAQIGDLMLPFVTMLDDECPAPVKATVAPFPALNHLVEQRDTGWNHPITAHFDSTEVLAGHQPIAHQQRSMLAGPEQKVRSLFTEGVNYALAKASRPNVRFQVVQVKCVLLPPLLCLLSSLPLSDPPFLCDPSAVPLAGW